MLRGNIVDEVCERSVEKGSGVAGADESEVMISCEVNEAVEQEWSRWRVLIVVAREGLAEGSVDWRG